MRIGWIVEQAGKSLGARGVAIQLVMRFRICVEIPPSYILDEDPTERTELRFEKTMRSQKHKLPIHRSGTVKHRYLCPFKQLFRLSIVQL
jgi:hypothetical protein